MQVQLSYSIYGNVIYRVVTGFELLRQRDFNLKSHRGIGILASDESKSKIHLKAIFMLFHSQPILCFSRTESDV